MRSFPQNLLCIDPKHVAIFYLVGSTARKRQEKNSTTILLQTPGKSPCLVKEPQEVINRDLSRFCEYVFGDLSGSDFLTVFVMVL